MPKHFMRIRDLGHSGAWEIIRRAKEMKETNYRGHCMDGKVAALIFEKASTRTRVSFDVAVRQLGGTTIFMTPAESQLGRSEPLRDTARVLSRYVDCLIVRTSARKSSTNSPNTAPSRWSTPSPIRAIPASSWRTS